jgi:hypothetical protein
MLLGDVDEDVLGGRGLARAGDRAPAQQRGRPDDVGGDQRQDEPDRGIAKERAADSVEAPCGEEALEWPSIADRRPADNQWATR